MAILLTASDVVAILPLRDQWMAANRSLAQDDSEMALHLFREFDHWYSEEKAVNDPAFREKLLRLWGLAALQAGFLGEGIELLVGWLQEFPDARNFRAFIRFQLASAFLATGETTRAIDQWSAFLEEHPDLPECNLVRWIWAECLLAESKPQEASRLLEEIVRSPGLPESGRPLAKAGLAIAQLASGNPETALANLESTNGGNASKLWKSILAPVLADTLLRNDQPLLALKSAHWFDSNENLLAQIAQVQQPVGMQRKSVRERIWGMHWQNQIRNASTRLKSTIEAGFGKDKLYLLRLAVYTRAGASTEALYLATALIDSGNPDLQGIRQQAYSFLIEACMALQKWDHANKSARQFLNDFPDSPELPGILYLQARCSASRKRWVEAIDIMKQAIARYSDNPDVLAWRFSCAKWLAQAGRLEAALDEMSQLRTAIPEPWNDYLDMEQAYCLKRLGQSGEAVAI